MINIWHKTLGCIAIMALSACAGGSDEGKSESDSGSKQDKEGQVNHLENKANIYKEIFAELKPDGKEELLLLGIDADSLLGTVIITSANGYQYNERPYIATPKKDGFWYLQYFRWKHESYTESFMEEDEYVPLVEDLQELVAEKSVQALNIKLGSRKRYQKHAKPTGVAIGEYGFYVESQTNLLYITNKYVSQHNVVSEYMGGAHPMNSGISFTSAFDKFGKFDRNSKLARELFKTCFTNNEWNALNKRLMARAMKGDFDDLLGDEKVDGREADTAATYMVFERGVGTVYGNFMADAEAYYIESGDYTFTAGERFEKPFCNKVLPVNEIPASLKDLARKTGCKDFALSPGHNFIVLMFDSNAEVVDVTTGEVMLDIPLRAGWRVVMTEWATGDFADKWWKEVVR
jgi:hypothetical protein